VQLGRQRVISRGRSFAQAQQHGTGLLDVVWETGPGIAPEGNASDALGAQVEATMCFVPLALDGFFVQVADSEMSFVVLEG
jgi:hypothetical protein